MPTSELDVHSQSTLPIIDGCTSRILTITFLEDPSPRASGPFDEYARSSIIVRSFVISSILIRSLIFFIPLRIISSPKLNISSNVSIVLLRESDLCVITLLILSFILRPSVALTIYSFLRTLLFVRSMFSFTLSSSYCIIIQRRTS